MSILNKVISFGSAKVAENANKQSKSLNIGAVGVALAIAFTALAPGQAFAQSGSDKAKDILGATAAVAAIQGLLGGNTAKIVENGVSSATNTVLSDEVKGASRRAQRIYNQGIKDVSNTIGTAAGNAVDTDGITEEGTRKRRSGGVSVGVSGQGDGVKVGAKYDKKTPSVKTKTMQVAQTVTAEEFAQAKQLLTGRDAYKTIENCQKAFENSSDPKGLALIKLVAADAASAIPDQKIRNQYVAAIQNGWNKSPSVGMN